MAVLQGALIDLVLLRVKGGEFVDDGAVIRADIRAYLPIALNEATTQFYYNNKKEELSRDFPSCFYAESDGLVIDRTGSIPKITLPVPFTQMPSNQGIRRITDNQGNTFTPVQDGEVSMVNYYASQMPNLRLFLPMGFQIIFLYNLTKLATTVNVVYMADQSSYTDNTVLPIAAGVEDTVLQLCVQHFSGQRQTPADVSDNQQDINASVQ